MGERKNTSRPIIVRFVSTKSRLDVLRKRCQLKGSNPKVFIVDDLTKSDYQLFLRAPEHPGTLRAWTKDGRIFAQSLGLKIFKIERLSVLSKLSIDATVSLTFDANGLGNLEKERMFLIF